jgi:hypothetical protein
MHLVYYAECRDYFNAMLSVIMLNVVMLSVVAPINCYSTNAQCMLHNITASTFMIKTTLYFLLNLQMDPC